jgi:hypothetical protein
MQSSFNAATYIFKIERVCVELNDLASFSPVLPSVALIELWQQ